MENINSEDLRFKAGDLIEGQKFKFKIEKWLKVKKEFKGFLKKNGVKVTDGDRADFVTFLLEKYPNIIFDRCFYDKEYKELNIAIGEVQSIFVD